MARKRCIVLVSLLFTSTLVKTVGQNKPAEAACAIGGIAKNALTGGSIAGVTVQLLPVPTEADTLAEAQRLRFAVPSGVRSPHSVVSDHEGIFCFEKVISGQYQLSGTKRGFLETNY